MEAAKESERVAKNPRYRSLVIETDVGDQESVDRMIDLVVQSFPRLDYAVNSAGVGHSI